MKETYKQLILDFHEAGAPVGTPREINFPKLPKNIRKAHIFIGMRRSGKTHLIYQTINNLLKQGVEQERMLYINFEDDRLDGIQLSNLNEILEAYFELYPEYLNDENVYLFFDEIHEVEGWEKFIRRLLDREKMYICISGSSSKMLSKEIASSLRGRTIVREVFPFNFLEFIKHKRISLKKNLSSKQKTLIIHECEQFLHYGGFAETIGANTSTHTELLQGYMDSVIYRDIVERHQVKNVTVLKRFLNQMLQNPATLLSVHKIYQNLKSMGYAVSKDSLYQFTNYFEDAYCFSFVSCFNLSQYKTEQKPKKIYPADQGLITAYSLLNGMKDAQRLETTVFCTLRRKSSKIFYYQTQDKKEVDFVVLDEKDQPSLFQVSLSLQNPSTRKRECDALNKAFKELNLHQGTIITMEEEETIQLESGVINVSPLWKFLYRSSL
ncbi:MAG: ATP-binding protein [Chlamydiales bacterium]